MTKHGKINTVQMFSVLMLSRIISLFTFMLPSTSYLPSGDRIITTAPVAVLECIYALIILLIVKKNDNKSIISAAKNISELSAKVTSVIFSLAFLWFAGIGTARFELFISTVMFPNSELHIMIFLLLCSALYAALKGLEAIGRTAFILLWILGLSIVFILLTVTDEFLFTNLQPVFTEGVSPILSFSFYVSLRAVELLTLYVTYPEINGSKVKLTFSWIAAFSIITAVILTVLSGVTGEYGNNQIFPLYTLTVIAQFGIFERLDDILTGVWVLCIFIHVAFLLYCSLLSLKQGFSKIKKLPAGIFCAVFVGGVYLMASRTVTVFSETVSSRIWDAAFLFILIVFPVIITLISVVKRRKKL